MAPSRQVCFLLLACLAITVQSHFAHSYASLYRWPTPEIRYQYTALPTLTVVEEDAYAMDDKMARVPLVLVPGSRLKVVHGGGIYYPQAYHGVPAIRIVLPQPMYVSQPTTMIEFPSTFTVLHDGYRVPVTIAAVLAPVYAVSAPQEVRVVYAVPAQTYPSYQSVGRPVSSSTSSTHYPVTQEQAYLPPTNSYKPPTNSYKPPSNTYVPPSNSYKPPTNSYKPPSNTYVPPSNSYKPPTNSYKPPTNTYVPPSNSYNPPSNTYAPTNSYIPPSNSYQPPANSLQPPTNEYLPPSNVHPPSHPAPQSGGLLGNYAPNRPVVTILDFPSAVASPGTLFFQPPIDPDSELGNRAPPQGVVPAGIVQSTAPLPNLSIFINSKESEVLQSLRDEAQKHRLSSNAYNSDYEVIVN